MRKKKPDDDPDVPSRRDQAKASLIEAAIALFADNDDVTVREIAEAAGLNHALVHYYFGSKEALREAAYLHATQAAAASMQLDPMMPVEVIASRVFAAGLAHLPAVRMLVRELISTEIGGTAAARRPAPIAAAVARCLRDDAGEAGREALGAVSMVFIGFLVQRDWMVNVVKLDDAGLARVQATAERLCAEMLRPFVRSTPPKG